MITVKSMSLPELNTFPTHVFGILLLWQQCLALQGKNTDCSKFGTSYFLQPKLLNGKYSPLQSTSRFIPSGMNMEESAVTTGSVLFLTLTFTLLLLKETKEATNLIAKTTC